jgi:ERCC4-type nuclease
MRNKKIKVLIDSRENDEIFTLAATLETELQSKHIDIKFIRKQLTCGDAICGNIVFERKEGDDFAISICDGRLDSQAEKLSLNFKHIYYIFVGDIYKATDKSKISPRAITGAQHHLVYKYGITPLYAKDKEQYIWLLYSVIKRHQEGKTFDPHKHKIIKYKITPSDRFVASLAATGIGKEKAKIIASACDHNMIKLHDIPIKELCELNGIGKTSTKQLRNVLFKTPSK